MARKKASAAGGQLAAKVLTTESQYANLKMLNSRLLKNMMEQREQINQLRSEQVSSAADREILDAVERDFCRLTLSGAAEKMLEKMEVIISKNNGDMKDLKAENKEKVGELKGSLEELREEKVGLDADYAEIKKEKLELGKKYDILKAENKENVLKVEALEEECRLVKEIRGQLEDEVSELKVCLEEMREEKEGLVADYADVKKSFFIKSDLLKKEELKLESYYMKEKEMSIQINDLEQIKMEKNLAKANYEIQISNLQENISKLQFARKCLEDECVAMQKEKNLQVEAAVALKRQLAESMNGKQMIELTLEELQKNLNHLNAENEEKKKQIDSLMVEKNSLEKHRETSIQGIDDMKKKLKTFEDSYSQLFLRLSKTITEVIGQESAQQNLISREIGAKVEKHEEMKLFVDNLEAINNYCKEMKLVVKGKETKIEELNQQLLQLSVAHGKNKKGTWKWLFPTTTTIFFAALAYAARAR